MVRTGSNPTMRFKLRQVINFIGAGAGLPGSIANTNLPTTNGGGLVQWHIILRTLSKP